MNADKEMEWMRATMQDLMDIAGMLKRGMTNLPNILASKGVEPERVDDVRNECDAMLEKLRSDLRDCVDES